MSWAEYSVPFKTLPITLGQITIPELFFFFLSIEENMKSKQQHSDTNRGKSVDFFLIFSPHCSSLLPKFTGIPFKNLSSEAHCIVVT